MCLLRLELNCERRTIQMAQDLDLPIGDIDTYIRKANAYILFYHVILKFRQWYVPGQEPHTIQELVNTMPISLYSLEDYEEVPYEMCNLYENTMPCLSASGTWGVWIF